MDIKQFIEKTPFLYHLTSKENARLILSANVLYSANSLIGMTKNKENEEIKTHKRFKHTELEINGEKIYLRDQRPISEIALEKCLTDNWTNSDFLYHLNDRVFMWPNLQRLERHFKRYQPEKPIIFRFSTSDILSANPHAKFCRLNSGATRPNSYLGGIAPERGPKTFLPAQEYTLPINSVAEVTFEKKCILKGNYGIDYNPSGNFKRKALK